MIRKRDPNETSEGMLRHIKRHLKSEHDEEVPLMISDENFSRGMLRHAAHCMICRGLYRRYQTFYTEEKEREEL